MKNLLYVLLVLNLMAIQGACAFVQLDTFDVTIVDNSSSAYCLSAKRQLKKLKEELESEKRRKASFERRLRDLNPRDPYYRQKSEEYRNQIRASERRIRELQDEIEKLEKKMKDRGCIKKKAISEPQANLYPLQYQL